MKERKDVKWGYKWFDLDMGVLRNFYGALAIVLSIMLILTIFMLKIWRYWNWEVGFIDPSTSFAESLIRLYNFIWSFLVLILVVVLILLIRIIYLFNWNSKIEHSFFLNKLLYYISIFMLNFSFIVDDKNMIEKNLLRLSQLVNGSTEFNIWYSNYKRNEFLFISDLNEYKQLEFIWCVLPACVLLLIAGPSFSVVFSLDAAVNPEINIKVVGKQWYWVYSFDNIIAFYNKVDIMEMLEELRKRPQLDWVDEVLSGRGYKKNVMKFEKSVNFNYDSVMINEEDLNFGTHRLLEVNNRLLVPIGLPIKFLITSTDVLHSWSLPSLGLKVDAVPGRLNQFVVELKRPGIFYGQCSELCGPMHGFMPIILHAVTEANYKNWLINL